MSTQDIQRIDELERHIHALTGVMETYRSNYQEEAKIVSRIWEVLGITTYAETRGKSIVEIVEDLKKTVEWYRAHFGEKP